MLAYHIFIAISFLVLGSLLAILFIPRLRQTIVHRWDAFLGSAHKPRTAQELQWINQRSYDILEAAGDGIFGVDREGRTVFANDAALRLLGYRRSDLMGTHCNELVKSRSGIEGDCCSCSQCPLCATYRDGISHRSDEDVFRRQDGSFFPAEYTSEPIREGKKLLGAVISFRDITERHEAQNHIRLSARVIDSMSEAVMVTDTQGVIQSVNPAFEKNTGYLSSHVVGQKPGILRSGHHDGEYYREMWDAIRTRGSWQGEIWNRRSNGEIYPEWLNISAIQDSENKVSHYIGIFSDISTQEQVQQRLHHLAYYDALTGLPNRQLFNDHLNLALKQSRRNRSKAAVLFLDLDRFKMINDTLGHTAGDQLLVEVAQRLKRAVREGDTIARLGGDEFTVLLPELSEPRNAVNIAMKIIDCLSGSIEIMGKQLHVYTSIGISIYPNDGTDVDTLIKNADTAMYRAKEISRGQYQLYEEAMSVSFRDRLQLENDLCDAIGDGQIRLEYQPRFQSRGKKVVGLEALARWRHPIRGDVSPETFIPIAEETGQIGAIGGYVIRQALQQLKQWQNRTSKPLSMAVNVSSHQLRSADFCSWMVSLLEEFDLRAEDVELELTESALIESHGYTADNIARLNDAGFRLAIDDFGTGYSSLSYLKRFPVKLLKIDQSFIKDLTEDESDAAMVTAILAMASSLGMNVIAEGVETREQLLKLEEMGCTELQGFYLSRPLSADRVETLLFGEPPVVLEFPGLQHRGRKQ